MAKASFIKAQDVFRANKGMLRSSQAKKLGVNEATLGQMLEEGLLIKEGRGLYRSAEMPPLTNPDLVQVSTRIPNGVICLISALNFHNLTTQIPYKIYIALRRGTKRPQMDYPPLEFIWPIDRIYSAGIEVHIIDDVQVKIYSKEKTIADCFKYRNKIGLDIAIEALKDYMRSQKADVNAIFDFAKIDKVAKLITPYLEALV